MARRYYNGYWVARNGLDSRDPTWGPLVDKAMNLPVPIKAGNFKKDSDPWS
jgi:hypothetical protein